MDLVMTERPSIALRIKRILGFKPCRPARWKFQDDENPPAVTGAKVCIHFDFLDRMRILLRGNVDVDVAMSFRTDSVADCVGVHSEIGTPWENPVQSGKS